MVQRIATGPEPVEIPPERNLLSSLWERADAGDDRQIVQYYVDGRWEGMTWPQLAERVEQVAAGLIASGVEPGDRVALLSPTRVEWTIADLAILATGGVTVPIYETSSVEQTAFILSDSQAKIGFAATADFAKTFDQARDRAPDFGEVFVFDDGGFDAIAERAGADERAQVRERAQARQGEDLFSLIYTSGTTGDPKGCMLTHYNMLWTAEQAGVVLQSLLKKGDSTLLFLPLAHVFARLVQYLFLQANVPIGYARSTEQLIEDLPSFRPTFLLSVPRVFEKIFNGAQRKATGAKRKIFDWAVGVAYKWSEAVNEGRSPGLLTSAQHGLADKLVYGKLREAMGGQVSYCVSGGAPLAPHLAHFFHAAGITILEGYGLTETTAPATVNNPEQLRIGTVGVPLPGAEIAVADDGEALVRGGNVFVGYYGDEEATRAVLDPDGWLHTGDLGELDEDGFLTITGRKKEIIVTAAGKNVAPAVLEERLKANPIISQAMVVGDNRPFVAALITLDPDELAVLTAEHGLEGSPKELAEQEPVRTRIQEAVDHANAAVSRAEGIKKTTVLERDFTQEDNELTPTLKLRRSNVVEHFADEIESLYETS